jgi:hypothetical protein
MYSPYKNEYGQIFKLVKNKNGTKVERRKIEMKQLMLQYIYTWKCHKEPTVKLS